MLSIIEVKGLTRKYGDLVAVDHLDFAVNRGEIFGFLGPNGAGKSTTVRMLTGFIPLSEGTVMLAGHDVTAHPSAARRYLGIVPEEANVYVDLTVWQNVMLMAELHGVSKARRTQHGRELLELFGLAERIKQKGRGLSKGLRQRLMLCMALVSDPEILFLDEPTSGLDVASSRLIREIIARMNRERGTTVFLTTHNLEEANELCHRVAIINKGCIAAIDTPQDLRATVESQRSVEVRFADQAKDTADLLNFGVGTKVVRLTCGFRIYGPEPGRMAQEIANRATANGIRIESLCTLEPSLEDVFVQITSKSANTKQEERSAWTF